MDILTPKTIEKYIQHTSNSDFSKVLKLLVLNAGQKLGELMKEGLNTQVIEDAQSLRACNKKNMLQRLVGSLTFRNNQFDPNSKIAVDKEVQISVNELIQSSSTLVRVPEACLNCPAGPLMLNDPDTACPVGQEMAKSVLQSYENNNLQIESLFDNRVPFPRVIDVAVTIDGVKTGSQIPEIAYYLPRSIIDGSYDTSAQEMRKGQMRQLYTQNNLDFDYTQTAAASVNGFKVGNTLLAVKRSLHNESYTADNIFVHPGIPFELRNADNTTYALQTFDLIQKTIELASTPDEAIHILDVGAGSGLQSLFLAKKLDFADCNITLVEKEKERAKNAKEIQEINDVTAQLQVINGDIREIKDLKPATHLIANFGKHYKDKDENDNFIPDSKDPFESILELIEEQKETLRYIVLGGFLQRSRNYQLSSEDIVRITNAGFRLRAQSELNKEGLDTEMCFVFTK